MDAVTEALECQTMQFEQRCRVSETTSAATIKRLSDAIGNAGADVQSRVDQALDDLIADIKDNVDLNGLETGTDQDDLLEK